ncbi:MAG TPA: DUF5666 domain-containing protein [bacterium]|nr:DUF5666 domain-containing protein [bacterium]
MVREMMRRTRSRMMIAVTPLMALAICAGTFPVGAAPAEATVVADGTIASVAGTSLKINTESGPRVVQVSPDTLILGRQATTLASIAPGDPMAVTSKRETDGSLTAISIVIFSSELWARARKGQWVMDSGNMMTNAVVMKYVDRVEGHTLYLKYNEGASAINVPPGTDIHRLVSVRLRDLKPGMRIMARGVGEADGSIKASSITFDRPGQM